MKLKGRKRNARKSKSDWWCSPPEIADPLEEFFDGPVDVDPCSNERSIIRSRVAFMYGGLVLPWVAEEGVPGSVYQNDPYSKAAAWTAKMLAELASGNVIELVRLSMMSTSSHWWSDMCTKPAVNPLILATRRIPFLDPENPVVGKRRMTCRFEPALTYIGPRPDRFRATFAHLTRWSAWGRS